ncbi:MAG: AraC family transcriptional regulator ligand-binding domain-containing protein [Mesorhizobium sp.]
MEVDRLDSIRLPSQSLRIMVSVLNELGIDGHPLMAAAGIDLHALDDPWSTLNGHQELRFEKAFSEATKHRPSTAFEVGLQYNLVTYGPLGLAVLVSPTVTHGLRLFTEMQALGYSILHYRLLERDGIGTALTANDQYTPPAMLTFVHERALGSVPTFLGDMCQKPFSLKYIESPLKRPKNWLGLQDRWQTEIMFGAARTAFHFAEGWGAMPLPMANPTLLGNYRRLCEKMLETSPNLDGFLHSVYQVLLLAREGFPTASEVAARLKISERTLHRHLAQRASSFGKVLDNVRLRRARELLEDSVLTLETISERIGYAETASFSRFFRRMTGTTPSSYRKTSRTIFSASNRSSNAQLPSAGLEDA